MKKFLKISSITIFSIGAFLYLIFLIAPLLINAFFDFDKYKSDIQKPILESSKLNLDYSRVRIYTTPLLSVGLIIDDINVTLPDNSILFSAAKIKSGIALPSLLTLTVKTAITTIDNPYINLEIADGKQYKIVSILEQIINENNQKPKVEKEPQEELPIDINKIKIKVPLIRIINYRALVKDLKTGHYLTLRGDKLNLGYNGPKNRVHINTLSELYSDENKNITADIKTIFSLPDFPQATEETDPEEQIAIPFINIVDIYQKYDLKTSVKSRLALINTKHKGYVAKGYVNVDNLSIKLQNIKLPESCLHAQFKGKNINYDSNIYAKSDEKISLNGYFNYGHHPHLKTAIASDEIHFQNLLDLLTALLNSLNIRNNLATIDAKGYLKANATIDTDFKKLKSQGQIIVDGGNFVSKQLNLGIHNLKAKILLDNNSLIIKDTGANIGESQLSAQGSIDTKSNVDIKISTTDLSIPFLYNIFAPKELKRAYSLKSANLNTNIELKGKLEDVKVKLQALLSNLSLSDTKNTMFISNNALSANFDLDNTKIIGKIENNGFIFNIPAMKTKTNIDKITIDMDNSSITINPFDFIYNSLSKINIKGQIKNYSKNPDIDLFLDGNIATANLLQTLGKDLAPYFEAKGNIPLKVSITGDAKKQDIKAQIFSNNLNYITPVHLSALKGNSSIIQADLNLKGSKIKFKDSGLYRSQGTISNDLNGNLSNALKLADFSCIIDNDHINLLRINVPKELTGQIAVFKKSSFKTKGKINLNGTFDDINFSGNYKVNNLSIPEILFKIKDIDLGFSNKSLNVDLNDIDLNGSKVNSSLKMSLIPAPIIKIDNLNVTSNLIDVDKAMVTADKAMKFLESITPPPAKNQAQSTQSADIPVNAKGKFNISKITTGDIVIHNAKGNLLIKNNSLLIDKLTAKAFDGAIAGQVDVNLITSLIKAKISGSNVNIDKMLTDAAAMKNTLSGTASFKTDISLKGATYLEQVESLKGTVWFSVKDGQYGPFAKLENFFLAENLRENVLFKNTIGAILSPITTIDSTHFEVLSGELSFNKGIANIKNIRSQGDILCILIKGEMNLAKNLLDTNVRVRLASGVSDALGPIALVNPVNLVKNTPGLNIVTAKAFSFFTQVVEESEYKEIPDFSAKHSDTNATKFQIILNGDVAKPLRLVKSFKWLNIQSEIDAAKDFSDKYVKEQEQLAKEALIKKVQEEYEADNKLRVGVEKVLQMDTTAPKVKQILLEEVVKNSTATPEQKEAKKQEAKETIKKEVSDQVQSAVQKRTDDFQAKMQEKMNNQIKSTLQQKLQEAQKNNSTTQ